MCAHSAWASLSHCVFGSLQFNITKCATALRNTRTHSILNFLKALVLNVSVDHYRLPWKRALYLALSSSISLALSLSPSGCALYQYNTRNLTMSQLRSQFLFAVSVSVCTTISMSPQSRASAAAPKLAFFFFLSSASPRTVSMRCCL